MQSETKQPVNAKQNWATQDERWRAGGCSATQHASASCLLALSGQCSTRTVSTQSNSSKVVTVGLQLHLVVFLLQRAEPLQQDAREYLPPSIRPYSLPLPYLGYCTGLLWKLSHGIIAWCNLFKKTCYNFCTKVGIFLKIWTQMLYFVCIYDIMMLALNSISYPIASVHQVWTHF